MNLLFILFILVPIVEIALLIQVGEWLGLGPTLGLIVLSAVLGIKMLRQQGLSILASAQQRAQQGEMPGQEVISGIVLAVGGALLLTPGFITDIIGFCCLLPMTRQLLVRLVLSRFVLVGSTHFQSNIQPESNVIEGEYKENKKN